MVGYWMDSKGINEKTLGVENQDGSNGKKKKGSAMANHGGSAFSRGGTNNERQIYYGKKFERRGERKWNRGEKGIEGTKDEIDVFNSDIEAILSPFKQIENSESKIDRNVIKYFAFVVILLPSIIGILAPSDGDSHWTSIDTANAVTDSFMVFLVSWFINFMIEWPWNWNKKIIQAKTRLLEGTEPFMNGNSIGDSMNCDVRTKKVVAMRKLSKYENYSLLLCFACTWIGAGIMRWSRNYVNMEDSRKKLVFSNLNIMLFLFLEMFRLILILTEKLQKHTADDIQEKIVKHNPSDKEKMIFIPPGAPGREANKFSGIINGLGSLVPTIKLKSNQQGNWNYQKLDLLQEKTNRQSEIIESLLISLANEYSRINLTLTKLEESVNTLNLRKSESTNNQKSIFLKPFPLNLSTETKTAQNAYKRLSLPSLLNNNKQPMHTIFEEDTDESSEKVLELATIGIAKEDQKAVSSGDKADNNFDTDADNCRTSLGNNSKQNKLHRLNSNSTIASSFSESIFEKPLHSDTGIKQCDLENVSEYNSNYFEDNRPVKHATPNSSHFSLHGLPFSSSIKDLVTRNSVYDEVTNIPYIKDYKLNSLAEIDNVQTSIRNLPEDKDFNFLHRLKIVVKGILDNVSLLDLITDPSATKKIINTEITPLIMSFGKERIESYVKTINIIKELLWDLSRRNFFLVTDRINSTIQKYLNPFERLKNMVSLICFRIPFNIIRFNLAIIFFLPKVFYHIFIAYPILSYREKIKLSRDTDKYIKIEYRAPTSEFTSIVRQSSMSSKNRAEKANIYKGNDKKEYNLKTRKMVLNKLLRYYDLKQPTENSLFTPVKLYDEE